LLRTAVLDDVGGGGDCRGRPGPSCCVRFVAIGIIKVLLLASTLVVNCVLFYVNQAGSKAGATNTTNEEDGLRKTSQPVEFVFQQAAGGAGCDGLFLSS
jgi:hypothetical protein